MIVTITPQLTITPTQTLTRHPLNFYESPSWFTTELLRHVKLSGVIGEPCVGMGAIASLLQACPYTERIWTNDIDANKPADYHLDATLSQSWDYFPECDWICTNPPYIRGICCTNHQKCLPESACGCRCFFTDQLSRTL